MQVPSTPLTIVEKFGYIKVAGHVLLSECKLCWCVLVCVCVCYLNCLGASDSIFSCVQLEDLLHLNAVQCFGVMTLDGVLKDIPKAALFVCPLHDLIAMLQDYAIQAWSGLRSLLIKNS